MNRTESSPFCRTTSEVLRKATERTFGRRNLNEALWERLFANLLAEPSSGTCKKELRNPTTRSSVKWSSEFKRIQVNSRDSQCPDLQSADDRWFALIYWMNSSDWFRWTSWSDCLRRVFKRFKILKTLQDSLSFCYMLAPFVMNLFILYRNRF